MRTPAEVEVHNVLMDWFAQPAPATLAEIEQVTRRIEALERMDK
jgi:hypothetical protein